MKYIISFSLLFVLFFSTSSAQMMPPDPANQNANPCYFIQNLNWNFGGDQVPLVSGKVRFPSTTCQSEDGPPENSPIAIFLHGDGMDRNDHDYLMAYLARNGIVTASISNGSFLNGSNEGRARQAISYLNSMHRFWEHRESLSNDVIFIGHSRGGESVATAARLLAQNPEMAFTPYDVKSVISIAPTDKDGGTNGDVESLNGRMTDGFLTLYGSHDRDVNGNAITDNLTSPQNTAFALYDRAGHEDSKVGTVQFRPISKSMIYIYGANHQNFKDENEGPGISQCIIASSEFPVSCEQQRILTRGYINAFIRWKALGEWQYQQFFDGSTQMPIVRGSNLQIFQQYSNGARRVIDNFQSLNKMKNTAGGSVTIGSNIVNVQFDRLHLLEGNSPHETKGMQVSWTPTNEAWVRWEVPKKTAVLVSSPVVRNDFSFLSFRVGQVYNGQGNCEGSDTDFNVTLGRQLTFTNAVQVSEFARVAYPASFISTAIQNTQMRDYSKSAMQTVRIPLSAFGDISANEINAIIFSFDVPGHRRGTIHIDNIELTN